MESERPMDRLVCGDVGFGKTEVALRAAVKAAADGKQVMILVPTTILAQQHFGTFRERLADLPFRVEGISRLRPAAETKAVLVDFEAGKVDILIGTHRLLSRDVRAKELGLVDRRRGAALRGQAEGAAAPAQAEGRRAGALGDADPAHPADEPRRAARHLGDRDAARGPPPGPHLRRPLRRGPGPQGDRARDRARRPGLLPPQPDRLAARDRRAAPRSGPEGALRRSPRPDGRARARGDDARPSCAATPTAW